MPRGSQTNSPVPSETERVQFYLAEAARLDALADQCSKQGDNQ